MESIIRYIVIALIGALASILSNRGIAVFNDGYRPIVGQFFNQEINRKELAAMSFAISFGLVIGFGIPTSIAASILLIHCLLLTTDMIGAFTPDSQFGAVLAGIIGAIYGLALLFGLEWIVQFFASLPYDFTAQLGAVSGFIIVGFAIFPAVGVALQHGFTKGLVTGIATVLAYFLTKKFGVFPVGESKITLSAEGIALLVGMLFMLFYAAREKGQGSANADLARGFDGNVRRIRKYAWLLALMGGLLAAGTSLSLIAGDPASLSLLSQGEYTNAALTALARAIGFVPLVFTTAIVTGVYGIAGCTFVFVVGFLLHGNPLVAFLVGSVILFVEIFLIQLFARGMDRFPGVKDMGEYVRTSMNKVLEVALLAGGIVAAENMANTAAGLTGIGALFVIGAYLLNRTSKKPVVDMAVGPIACILFGVLLNVLLVIGLITKPIPPEEKKAEEVKPPQAMEIAEKPELSHIDEIVEKHLQQKEFPGAVVVVTKDGKIVYEKAYGYALFKDGENEAAQKREMTVDTLFDLASVTKVMATTQSVMQLVSEGKIDLQEKVQTYIPDFGQNGKGDVTIEQLLTHTSGLPQWKPIFLYVDHDRKAVLDYICGQPLMFQPGEEKYSDLGFQMLGFVVEAVSGEPMEQYVATHIYQPLGLTHTMYLPLEQGIEKEQIAATSIGNPFEKAMVDEVNYPGFGYDCTEDANAYQKFQGWRTDVLIGAVNDGNCAMANGGVAGHAGLYASAPDLAVLCESMLNKGTYQGIKLYEPEVFEEFIAQHGDDASRGLGFERGARYMGDNPDPNATFGHSGFTGTQVVMNKEDHTAVIFLTNKQNLGIEETEKGPQYPSTFAASREICDFVHQIYQGK